MRPNNSEMNQNINIENFQKIEKADIPLLLVMFGFTCCLGLAFMIGQKTMIGLKTPFLICLITGIVLTPLSREFNWFKGEKKHWIIEYPVFFMLNTFGFGSIILFGFLGSNYLLADKEQIDKQYLILKKEIFSGSRREHGRKQMYTEVNYQGKNFGFKFEELQIEKIQAAKYINVVVRKGFWDIDVLDFYYIK